MKNVTDGVREVMVEKLDDKTLEEPLTESQQAIVLDLMAEAYQGGYDERAAQEKCP